MILFQGAEVDGRSCDVRVADDRIVDIAPHIDPTADDEVVDCHGGALLPGLHDHHLHLFALAARSASVLCGPPDVLDISDLRTALRQASTRELIRGVGYHASVAGELDRALLDSLVPDVPVRIQERAGALWVLNTPALRLVGVDPETHDGRFLRMDDWLRERLPPTPLDLAAVGSTLARFGITGVTDATPDLDDSDVARLVAAVDDGALPQRLMLLGAPAGTQPHSRVAVGPHKILLPDHDLPAFDVVRKNVATVHDEGRAVAVHCVTVEALALVLAVLDDVGPLPGDRIEHGAVLPDWSLPRMRALDLRVVTQPAFVADRGDDYLRDVDADDQPFLYRHRALLDAGIGATASSDAPFGPLDPWLVIRAARDRRTPAGAVVAPTESVSTTVALDGLLTPLDDPGGPPRRLTVGAPADLCLLGAPLVDALRDPDAARVRMTLAGGHIAYRAP